MPVTTIQDSNHLTTELTSAGGKLCVLDFTAKWCGPCNHISPEVDRLSGKYTSTKFLKVDVDDCSDVAQEYAIRSMPTFVFVKNSLEVTRFSGADPNLLESTIIKHGSTDTFTGSGYSLNSQSSTASGTQSLSSSERIGGWLGSLMSSVTGSTNTPSPSNLGTEDDEMNLNYEQQAKEIFPVDKDHPTCKIQVRLLDGKKLTVTLTNSQEVSQLREYIKIARPAYAEIPFVLFSGHPAKMIQDESVSLETANLANAVVVLQLKK